MMRPGRPLRNGFLLAAAQLAACAAVIRYSGVIEPSGDAPAYLGIARHVAGGLGFSYDGVTPFAYLPPIFSSLLGFWFFLTRTDSVLSASVFQSLALAAGALATYALYRELFDDDRLAAALAFVVALNPLLFVNAVYVVQEPVLLLATTVALWLTLRYLRRRDMTSAAAAGVAWGAATLAKVVTWFAPFLLAFLMALRSTEERAGLRRAALIVVLSLAVIFPWTARNYLHFHQFIPVNNQGTGALEWFVSRGTLTKAGGDVLVQELQAKNPSVDEHRRELWRFALAHPTLSIEQVAKNVIWFTQPYREWFGNVAGLSMRWYVWLWPALFFHAPLYVGLFVSGLVAWKQRHTERLFLFLFYLLYWGEYATYWGDPRFAMPVFPVLLGLGADGLRRSAHWLSSRLK